MTAPADTGRVPAVAYPWTPDQGDGTFRNPVIAADYSDPDLIRDGDDFWMTASSFNCTPGLPVLHSRDLVNWTLVNHAVKNLPDPRGVFDLPRPGEGVWAPSIREHDGRFWIFFPMPDEGLYVTTADDPRGRWSEPHLLLEGKGFIDPCPLWDDDGRAYLVHAYANSRCGIKHRLTVRPMSPDGTRLLGKGRTVFDEPERHPTCEGPKFYKRDGYYYIAAPAGGVPTGWQLVLRSRDVYGPFEEKIVLEQGSTPVNGPHQGALVDTPGGEWWFAHFQDAELYGRVVHLQPVTWRDGWPLMGVDHDGNGVGEPVLRHPKPAVRAKQPVATPQTSDEFDGPQLGLQWQWHANHRDNWHSLTDRPGHLRLYAVPTEPSLARVPNLLLQKFPAYAFSVETALTIAAESPDVQAGLIVAGNSSAAVVLTPSGTKSRATLIVDDEIRAGRDIEGPTARVAVEVASGGGCTFLIASAGGSPVELGRFRATQGKWIGAKVGLFCRSTGAAAGHADVAYFRFGPPARG